MYNLRIICLCLLTTFASANIIVDFCDPTANVSRHPGDKYIVDRKKISAETPSPNPRPYVRCFFAVKPQLSDQIMQCQGNPLKLVLNLSLACQICRGFGARLITYPSYNEETKSALEQLGTKVHPSGYAILGVGWNDSHWIWDDDTIEPRGRSYYSMQGDTIPQFNVMFISYLTGIWHPKITNDVDRYVVLICEQNVTNLVYYHEMVPAIRAPFATPYRGEINYCEDALWHRRPGYDDTEEFHQKGIQIVHCDIRNSPVRQIVRMDLARGICKNYSATLPIVQSGLEIANVYEIARVGRNTDTDVVLLGIQTWKRNNAENSNEVTIIWDDNTTTLVRNLSAVYEYKGLHNWTIDEISPSLSVTIMNISLNNGNWSTKNTAEVASKNMSIELICQQNLTNFPTVTPAAEQLHQPKPELDAAAFAAGAPRIGFATKVQLTVFVLLTAIAFNK